ncbi:trypsin-like serine protease [Streptomyces sp. AV19]|uniref:S1 family peptidase n=1 Tax=Streptomyces sp. AV19 TaxID=2793068 RepID=UPI0018FE772A|nr:trypsin-like serine protease [Streptomyces sp. AV19]MBH1933624.1 trypsin-like serine protease [Streptomyces sp. AV19]MDG4535870.1 trypsin-like serine protease [Streptomyces sp. AV19]
MLTAAPAHAVVGEQAKDDAFAFTAKLDIGGERSCSAALVGEQWLVTAASCFADDPARSLTVRAGTPKVRTIATIGRTDLTRGGGSVVEVVELVPRTDRDLVMARLATPVTGVAPIGLGANAVLPGEDLWVAGYGRTRDEWVPDRLHHARFTVDAVKSTSIGLSGKSPDATVCQGDTGGPAFREIGGRYELAGINSMSGQGGCFGTDESVTSRAAANTRVDDITGWIHSVAYRDVLKQANWKNVAHLASGRFTNAAGAAAKRRMDLFVIWKDGSASIFPGSDSTDPKTPFSAEHKVAKAGSDWQYASVIAAGNFAGSGTDGLFVRWKDAEVTEYGHLDLKGAHNEKTLKKKRQLDPKNFWNNARLITVGRYSGNSLRDDVLVLWENGSTSLYTDIHSKELNGYSQLSAAANSWKNATQISAGEFNGKKTSDLLIQWKDGETSVFPGVDAKGYHGRTKINNTGSAWKNAHILTTGAFTNNDDRVNDILISWNNGNLGLYPDVDGNGTHGGIELLK